MPPITQASRDHATDEGVDTITKPATSEPEASSTDLGDSLTTIGLSFLWFNDHAQQRIEAMRGEIKEKDEPPWMLEVLESLIEVAIGAGAGAAGQALMQRLKSLSGKSEVRHEFVKGLFEEGIKTGVATGKSTLRSGKHDEVADSFVDSQRDAARAHGAANQKSFVHKGRHTVKTVEEAHALEELCTEQAMHAAGEAQAAATRDAWVSYLAQSKFGSVHRGDGVTTNMANQEHRDSVNGAAPGFVPSRAPTVGDAMYGRTPGVLEVVAELPEIGSSMEGQPTVKLAMLDGVNATIREAYEGKPLAELHIPRQIMAKVSGDMPDFTVNLDEQGNATRLTHAQASWVRARAVVGHPEAAQLDDLSKKELGLRLLLEELTASSIRGGLGR